MAHVQGIGALGLLCEWALLVEGFKSGLGASGSSRSSHPSTRCHWASGGMVSTGVEQQESEVMGESQVNGPFCDISCVFKIIKFLFFLLFLVYSSFWILGICVLLEAKGISLGIENLLFITWPLSGYSSAAPPWPSSPSIPWGQGLPP